MKLRIHANSLRLRLTQTDVARLRSYGRVDAEICFAPGRTLFYSIERAEDAAKVSAAFEQDAVRIVVSTDLATRWTDSDEVAIEARQAVGPDLDLHLLIEKDFHCFHRSAEQDPDAYPNPLQTGTAS